MNLLGAGSECVQVYPKQNTHYAKPPPIQTSLRDLKFHVEPFSVVFLLEILISRLLSVQHSKETVTL